MGLLPKICEKPGKKEGLRGWFKNCDGVPYPLDEYQFAVRLTNFNGIIEYLSADYERFALSCAESLIDVKTGNQNYFGWRLLKLYYAAFFSAHSVMRGRGSGVVNLSKNDTVRIRELADLYEVDIGNFHSGNFFFRLFENENEEPVIAFRSVMLGSGVHDSFWREFCNFLETEAKSDVAKSLPNSADFLASTIEVLDCFRMGNGNSKVWLSEIRNQINYQHKHEVWFPTPRRTEVLSVMGDLKFLKSSSFRLDTSWNKEPIRSFTNVTSFTAFLGVEIGDFVAARSTRGGTFGQKWRRIRPEFDAAFS